MYQYFVKFVAGATILSLSLRELPVAKNELASFLIQFGTKYEGNSQESASIYVVPVVMDDYHKPIWGPSLQYQVSNVIMLAKINC